MALDSGLSNPRYLILALLATVFVVAFYYWTEAAANAELAGGVDALTAQLVAANKTIDELTAKVKESDAKIAKMTTDATAATAASAKAAADKAAADAKALADQKAAFEAKAKTDEAAAKTKIDECNTTCENKLKEAKAACPGPSAGAGVMSKISSLFAKKQGDQDEEADEEGDS